MGESKFACPVCGQHITADSSAAGEKLECPTCFRNIIVPESSSSNGTKLIISAAHANKPRPIPSATTGSAKQEKRGSRSKQFGLLAVVVVSMCLGAGAALFWDKVFPKKTVAPHQAKGDRDWNRPSKAPPRISHPIPSDIQWNLQLANAEPPKATASGNIHGNGFVCDRANLWGGLLNLRQGKNGPTDLELTIGLPVRSSEELSGRTFEIKADEKGFFPTVTLRWWDDEHDKMSSREFKNGYAMKLVFEQADGGHIPGRIFISCPDPEKSVVAGSFEAEYRPGGGFFRPAPRGPGGNR